MILPLCPDLISVGEIQHKPPVGMFRDVCVHIQRPAKFYLTVNQYRADKLLTFDNFQKRISLRSFSSCHLVVMEHQV